MNSSALIFSTTTTRSRSTFKRAHLFKHATLGIDDVYEVWRSDPHFCPAKPPAHWLMVGEVGGTTLVVPLAPPDSRLSSKCRPIGCYVAATHLAERYRTDRNASDG